MKVTDKSVWVLGLDWGGGAVGRGGLVGGGTADSETRMIVVIRGTVVFETLAGLRKTGDDQWDYRIEPSSPIHYVKIVQINGSTAHDLKKLERRLRTEGARALVLDLRGDESYDLHYALLLADVLIDEGVLGRLRTGDRVREYRSDRDRLFRDWPLAVLVDRNTSGGGEWIAAALKENRAAAMVGERTSGFVDIPTPAPLHGAVKTRYSATQVFGGRKGPRLGG